MTSTLEGNASSASWKVRREAVQHTELVDFCQARQFFAVDASGSTAGYIIRNESEFVDKLRDNPLDSFTRWGSACDDPTSQFDSIIWSGNLGGTSPSRILKNDKALSAIGHSDVWYLLTDGEIWDKDVPKLCRLAMEKGVTNVPIIFVITGHTRNAPSDVNISVGISFFANASDVLMLYKELGTGYIYIMAAKGCFAELASTDANLIAGLSSWEYLQRLDNEEGFQNMCSKVRIRFPAAASRPKLSTGAIDLGEKWQRDHSNASVDLELLLRAGVLSQEDLEGIMAEDAFTNLSVACKTRGRMQDLRTFLQAQKINEFTGRLEDVHGAASIIARLSSGDLESKQIEFLQQQLREAHAQNRRAYQLAVEDLEHSEENQATKRRNRLVNDGLQQLAELEKSTYTADILSRKSNRAKRATTVAAGGEVSVNSLDLNTPIAFRGECQTCCGDEEIMAISIKAGADGAANTDDFALDFPMAAGRSKNNSDLISSQPVCFQCALAMEGKSLYHEDIVAVIPTLEYTGQNKSYIQGQLYLSLTGGLKTGASGTSQLFLTILDHTMETKEWARVPDTPAQASDSTQRGLMLQWMIDNMLKNTGCRETFSDQGPWVTFPEALAWAVRDFDENGIDSWAIQYPLHGFVQLLAFGLRTGEMSQEKMHELRAIKLFYLLTSAYHGLLQKHGWAATSWKQPLMAIIYANFNADGIPVDKRGPKSLVNHPDHFWARLSAFLVIERDMLIVFTAAERTNLMRRCQLLAFWLHYTCTAPTRTKTFFATLRIDQPLAAAVLAVRNEPLSAAMTDPILLSIFRATDPADPAFAALHAGPAPFATPFGPSVLRCAFPACAKPFMPAARMPKLDYHHQADWPAKLLDQLRDARTQHLVRAFAVDPAFATVKDATGMPEPTAAGARPASTHINLHVSVARCWSRMSVERRGQVAFEVRRDGKGAAVKAFVGDVKAEICAGRRGDVFRDGLEATIYAVLPSFLDALEMGLLRQGKGDAKVESFEHNWKLNKFVLKVVWEQWADWYRSVSAAQDEIGDREKERLARIEADKDGNKGGRKPGYLRLHGTGAGTTFKP